MPRISEELRASRRRHVLTSAWTCFSRNGFHATSMDEIIAASGMSAGAVYRYFRGKDELIDATVDEVLGLAQTLFTEMLAADPAPTPAQALVILSDTVRSRGSDQDYNLAHLGMQAWTEALRRPHLRDRTRAYYRDVRSFLERLARRWQQQGDLAPTADPAAVAALLVTLMPGMIVSEYLIDHVSGEQLLAGVLGLAGGSTG
jgi:AcrR family transcriptional regulator